MLTWKRTWPSGNTLLNIDSAWVPHRLPSCSCQTPNQCPCLHVWIHVSGCFWNVWAPRWSAGLPSARCVITQQTQTVALTLTTQNYSLLWIKGEMWISSGRSLCVPNLVKTLGREFDGVITHLCLHHLCSRIYYREGDRAGAEILLGRLITSVSWVRQFQQPLLTFHY